MTEHVGYGKHETSVRATVNPFNGTRAKTIPTEITGLVEIEVSRDRDGRFRLVIVAERQRRLTGVVEMVPTLSAKGLSTGEISSRFAEIYDMSKNAIPRIGDRSRT